LWFVSSGGPNITIFGRFGDKLYAIMAFANFMDEQTVLLDRVIVACVYLALYCLIRSRSLVLAPAMRLPLIFLGLAALLMPNWLNGSWAADIRLPVALPFIVIAATQIDVDSKWGGVLTSVALALLATRVWSVMQTWGDYDNRLAELRTATSVIQPGSRLLVVQAPMTEADRAIPGMPTAFGIRSETAYWHMPAFAVIDRSAFIPYLFTGWTTVKPAQRNTGLFRSEGTPLTPPDLVQGKTDIPAAMIRYSTDYLSDRPYWENWPKNFDYVLSIDFKRRSIAEIGNLDSVAEGSFFELYHVVRP
jgi:hypothetical protein